MIILPPLDDHLKQLAGTATSFRALFIVGFRLVPENPDLNENPGQRPVKINRSGRLLFGQYGGTMHTSLPTIWRHMRNASVLDAEIRGRTFHGAERKKFLAIRASSQEDEQRFFRRV